MYIFSNLNYLFNGSEYYSHILRVTEETFLSESFNLFGNKGNSLIGILGKYEPEHVKINKLKEYFILDIDNKNLFNINQRRSWGW